MKKLMVITITVAVLVLMFCTMMRAGYSWPKAAAFDFILLLVWLAILFVMKFNQAFKEFRREEDDYYDA